MCLKKYVSRILYLEFFSDVFLYALHYSAMVVSFQMNTTVDKDKCKKIVIRTLKCDWFSASVLGWYVYFSFSFWKWEAQYVSWVYFSTIGLVELFDTLGSSDDERELVRSSEDSVFDSFKGNRWYSLVCFVGDMKCVLHKYIVH